VSAPPEPAIPPEAAISAQVDADLVREILVAVCERDGLSLESSTEPGEPARNYELALRLGIGRIFGLPDREARDADEWPVPPGAVTAGIVEAAQAHDLAHRSNYVSWTRPPDYQVARLIAGALPLIAEQAAAAERERITLALLGCVTCGKVHKWREIPPQPGDHEGYPRHTYEDPGDGHPYRAAWAEWTGDVADPIGGGHG